MLPAYQRLDRADALRDQVIARPEMAVSVNISASELQDSALAERITRVLQLSGLPSQRLEIEVTENALLSDPDKTLAVMPFPAGNGRCPRRH
jgi:EAL domain-containing protein (putative c-di-GMP-specific phosphodiesterase class I)